MPWGTEGFGVVSTLSRSRLAAPLGPARYVGMVRAVARDGLSATVGFAAAAQRCPSRRALIDELGALTCKQLDDQIDAAVGSVAGLHHRHSMKVRARGDTAAHCRPPR